jgi:hypothetical protein
MEDEDPMVSTVVAAEVTGVLEGLRRGLETQGRALGATVRDLAVSVVGAESAPAWVTREISLPPRQFVGRVASTLGIRDADRRGSEPVIVERVLTRC